MNLLQLVNRIKRKCGVSGASITTVANQVEEINRLVDYANEAWMELQLSREDWFWMRGSASCPTVQGQSTYAPSTDFALTNFGNWAVDTFRNYVTATGPISEVHTEMIGYEEWRNTYMFGANRYAYTRPVEVTITPNLSIGVGPVAAAGYTLTGDYYKVATELVTDTDTPAMPDQFHMIIVYRAMMYYGAYEAAGEVAQEGATGFKRLNTMLVLNQLTPITLGNALA